MPDRLSQDDAAFIARAKRLLDSSVADLDQSAIFRLQRARLAALSEKSVPRWRWVRRGGLAMATITALTVLLWTKQPVQDNHPPLLEDMELMMSAENVELAQDLEFYHWLADADTTMG